MEDTKKLAIEDGIPRFKPEDMHSIWPVAGEEEEIALKRVLRSGHWCRLEDKEWTGGEAGQFERELGQYLDIEHVLAVVNGTEAIDAALRALELKRGDEVLVQASTYFGTVTPILRLGLIPVFVDFDPETYAIDLACLEDRITPKTRAVIVAHLGGLCPDMEELERICRKHSLALIEDCAQALGSVWDDSKMLGTIGDAGTFSFQQSKMLTAGEGGAIVCRDPEYLGRLYAFHQGFSMPGAPDYRKHEVSTNLRISSWQAAVLRCQLRRLDEQSRRRMDNYRRLLEYLGSDSPLIPVKPHPRLTRWSIYNTPFKFNPEAGAGLNRDQFLKALGAEGIPCFEGHTEPLYMRPLFKENQLDYRNDGCPESERIAGEESIVIMQWFYLGPDEWMERLAQLVRDITARVPMVKQFVSRED